MTMTNRAVFFDRDGVINKEVSYLDSTDKVEILPGTAEAIKLLNQKNFKVVIITNQSGIARGYFTINTLNEIHNLIQNELMKSSAKIDAFYFCPHLPSDDCECRKPKIGLIKKAEKELDIDLTSSYFIGDTISDLKAGINAGLKSILVLTGYGEKEKKKLEEMDLQVDYITPDTLSAVSWILKGV
jgi:histidinol-phosphate phosphatase family protein